MTDIAPSKWEILAKERNARVILCHTPDTYLLLDIARAADRGIRALRNRLLISLTPDDVLPLLEAYNQAAINLHQVVEEICRRAEIEYRTPRAIKKVLEHNGNGNEQSVLQVENGVTNRSPEEKEISPRQA